MSDLNQEDYHMQQPSQQPQQPALQYVNPYIHMNAQIVQNGAICVRDGIEYQIYFDEDGTLSFHQVEFHTSTSIDGEEAEQLRQSVEEAEQRAVEAERRAEEAEQQVRTLKQQLEKSQRESHDARQVVQELTKFIEGEEEKKTSEALATEAPSSSWSETVSSTPVKGEEKEEEKEEKKTPKIVVKEKEHVVLKTDNKYSTDSVGILREILPQLQEWLLDLNGSGDTVIYRYIDLDEEYMWLAKILGVTKTKFDVSINGIPYEIGSCNKRGDCRVMIPFLNTVLKKIGVGCFVSDRGTNFRYLKLKITNQEKFEQNLSSLGDYLDESDANILSLIEENCRN